MSIDRTRTGRAERRRAPRPLPATEAATAPMTKATLSVISGALQEVFASSLGVSVAHGFDPAAPPLTFAFFQRHAYFSAAAARFGAYQAVGVTTIVGFPGEAVPEAGIDPLDLTGRPEIDDAWVLGVFDGALAGVVVAVDDKGLMPGPTLEASRRFIVRWTVDPVEAVAAARQLLAPIRPRLDRRTLALAEGALRRSEETDPGEAAPHYLSLLQALAPLAALPTELPGRDDIAERDLLTGLHNRRFLEHYLPEAGESGATVAALLVDVDDLGALNERLGVAAGDAALVAVAGVLAAEHRAGDVLVRYGEDEFLLLAGVDGPDGAVAIAERIVVATRAARLDYPFEAETVTVSVGVITADPADLPYERLNDALGLAKLLGKNVARLAD